MANTVERPSTEFAHLETHTWFRLGPYQQAFQSGLHALEDAGAARRIWDGDGSLWKQERETVTEIEDRLGWLELPTSMPMEVSRLTALAMEVQAAGMERVLLLGMGGSSLAPEVMRCVLGVSPGYPDLVVLDTTDPTQIRRVTQAGPLSRSTFIVASKSGTTEEMQSLFAHFRAALIAEVGEERWARHFVAITDAGTELEALARAGPFRALYLNPSDVGGRFSALSFFGLVPAAFIGADLDELLRRAKAMAWQCRAMASPADNPGLLLGAIIGELACQPAHPRDKLTLLTSPKLSPFGAWAEQLIAESTGKDGVGILPVEGEWLRQLERYGPDRLFVYLRLDGDQNATSDARVSALVEAGEPVVVLRLTDPYDVAAEFFRWEFATAVAGQRLGVNPFDQPDVESAKVRTHRALERYRETHSLPEEPVILREGVLSVYAPDLQATTVSDHLRAFLAGATEGDHVALMAYIERNATNRGLLQSMRHRIGEALHLAVTLGFGPRFLHSTGQLHKGGANNGLFLQITQDETDDLPIPGQPYSFGVLKRAQALGDFQALRGLGRRAMRVNLGADVQAGLRELGAAIDAALR
jgi:glucose-6-phosphate isomerase